jgi:hypothetical protein
MWRALSAAGVLLAACNSPPGAPPGPEPPSRAPVPPVAPASPGASARSAGDLGDPAPPPSAAPSCVEACVARRQMQAVSPEQIEAKCRGECEKR